MIDLYRAPNPRYSMSNLIPCLFEKIYQPREMLLRPARPKLWPARPKLWPAQRGKHSIKLTYDPRLSDKSGGPAPPCDGYIRLLTQRTSSRIAALCASPAQSAGAVSGHHVLALMCTVMSLTKNVISWCYESLSTMTSHYTTHAPYR